MNLLTDLLDGIGSLSGKRISVLFFFFSFATNAKNSKCIDCGRIVKLWHEYYFVLEIKQWMTFEDNRERNIEILARSHSTYRLRLAFFRGRTFDCLVKRRVYIHQVFESTSKLVTRAVLIAQKWQSVLLSTWIRNLEKHGIYTKEHILVLFSSHHHGIHALCPIYAHKQRITSTSLSNAIMFPISNLTILTLRFSWMFSDFIMHYIKNNFTANI